MLLDGNLAYVERAADLADAYLATIGRREWAAEIRLAIENHHKCRAYRGPHAELVEAGRRADWIDVSFTRLTFGLPRAYVREVAAAFPLDGLYPLPAWKLIGSYAVRHLRDPLPMMRL